MDLEVQLATRSCWMERQDKSHGLAEPTEKTSHKVLLEPKIRLATDSCWTKREDKSHGHAEPKEKTSPAVISHNVLMDTMEQLFLERPTLELA